MKRIKSAATRWRTSYKVLGELGLQDTRKLNNGRPSTKNLSLEEKLARLEAKNKLLMSENELLKKLDILERRLIKKK